jgi:hypothetical protein
MSLFVDTARFILHQWTSVAARLFARSPFSPQNLHA